MRPRPPRGEPLAMPLRGHKRPVPCCYSPPAFPALAVPRAGRSRNHAPAVGEELLTHLTRVVACRGHQGHAPGHGKVHCRGVPPAGRTKPAQASKGHGHHTARPRVPGDARHIPPRRPDHGVCHVARVPTLHRPRTLAGRRVSWGCIDMNPSTVPSLPTITPAIMVPWNGQGSRSRCTLDL